MWFTVALKTGIEVLDYLDRNTFSVMDEFRAQSVMLIGDFNVYHKEWLGSNVTHAAGQRALQLANCLGLEQIVTEPTRHNNILDLVLSDSPATTKTLANMGSSDYYPVHIQKNYQSSEKSHTSAESGDMTKLSSGK